MKRKDIPGYIVTIWLLIVIIILAYMTSCEKIDIQMDSQDFVIEKGQHESTWIMEDWGAMIVQDWTLDESCIYDLGNDNQHDWNKLTGLVYKSNDQMGFGYIHKYSCRVVWRWDLDRQMFNLAPYIYEGGERFMFTSDFYVYPDELFRTAVYDYGDYWKVIIETHEDYRVYREGIYKDSRNLGHYKVLTPYFGGDEVAPHRMVLESEFVTIKRTRN